MIDRATLRQTAELVQRGRFAEAASLARRVLSSSPGDPDALHLLGIAAWKTGDPAAGEEAFRGSIATGGRPETLIDYAEFLRAQGRIDECEAALREATGRGPTRARAWLRLGALLHAQSRTDEAAQCAARAAELAPKEGAAWELCAAIAQKRGDVAAAISACDAGLQQLPDAARLHYARAQLLRQACRFAKAASGYDDALRCGYREPELFRNAADAWLEAGESARALASLDAGVNVHPENAALQRTRARLHWEAGADGDPLATLWRASRAHPGNALLWETLADLLNRLDRKDEAQAVVAEARASGCPATPDLAVLEAVAVAARDTARATQLFAAVTSAYAQHRGAALAFAAHLLATDDPVRAETLCARVLVTEPFSQLAWAYRSTAWRLLGDAREAWLVDYERMVVPVRVPAPAGWANDAAFYRDVRAELESLHMTHAHPIEQTLRGGTQTNGFLFRHTAPVLGALEAQIRGAVREVLAAFPDDPRHPFWGRRGAGTSHDDVRFVGAWSVRLQSQGYHTNHVHPEGWISSALYVSVPAAVRNSLDGAGHLQFGVPPSELGLALPPRRVVKPEVGMLTLFPSYCWHGTVPFESAEPRITVAFDLQPQGSARPPPRTTHRAPAGEQ